MTRCIMDQKNNSNSLHLLNIRVFKQCKSFTGQNQPGAEVEHEFSFGTRAKRYCTKSV